MMLKGEALALLLLVLPSNAWAGFRQAAISAPTLGDAGLIALAVGLIAVGGFGIFRRR